MKRTVLPLVVFMMGFGGVVLGDLTPEQTKQAEALIAQFTHPEFAVRQKAVAELIKTGLDVLPLVKKTLAETKDAEVKLRCRMVIAGITEAQRKKDWDAAVARFNAMPDGVRLARWFLMMFDAQGLEPKEEALDGLIALGPGVLPLAEEHLKRARGGARLCCEMAIRSIKNVC